MPDHGLHELRLHGLTLDYSAANAHAAAGGLHCFGLFLRDRKNARRINNWRSWQKRTALTPFASCALISSAWAAVSLRIAAPRRRTPK